MAQGTCEIEGCVGPIHAKGFCGTHYMRLLRRGDPNWGRNKRPLTGRTRRVGDVRKYTINHAFFDHVDSEEKAYWLGFFTADGCVLSGTRLQINLQATDAEHLRKLSASTSSTYPVGPNYRSPQSGPSVHWVASSAPLVRALGELGVGPRKSASVQPWDGPADLIRHYWRGMIDGDGGFSLRPGRNSASKSHWYIFLTGSRACVEGFATWARAISGSRAQSRPNGRSAVCWVWGAGGNRIAKQLTTELYGGCRVSLERKQALADVIMNL